MRKIAFCVLLFVWVPVLTFAQTAGVDESARASTGFFHRVPHGYVFGGVGGITPGDVYTFWGGSTTSAGAGFEFFGRKHTAFAVELEWTNKYQVPAERQVTVPSINFVYHILGRDAKRVDPFAMVGTPGIITAGGLQYWWSEHLGLRLEARNNALPFSDAIINCYGFRFGFAFR